MAGLSGGPPVMLDPAARAFALFDTPVGRCAIAWSGAGLIGLALPGADEAATRSALRRRLGALPEAVPPVEAARAIERIVAMLAQGARDDLADLPLDLAGVPPFHARVFALARRIPPGATRRYGELAAELGGPAVARAVGQALGANPFPIVVPCHRVLGAGGRAGGFSAPGGTRTKLALLELEGAPLGGGTPGLFDR